MGFELKPDQEIQHSNPPLNIEKLQNGQIFKRKIAIWYNPQQAMIFNASQHGIY